VKREIWRNSFTFRLSFLTSDFSPLTFHTPGSATMPASIFIYNILRNFTFAGITAEYYFYTRMKNAFRISLLLWLSISLCSCPYSSPYKLDDEPTMYVEDVLLGSWSAVIKKENSLREEPVKLVLSKKNDTEYFISITGDMDELRQFDVMAADSINGTAFMSTVGSNQFLNISIKSQTYIAELRLKDGRLSILPLVEHFTSKLVQNNAALRTCVDFHYKTRVHPMVDEDFCLKDMVKVN
jgi:hypothetical protein